MKSDSFAKTEAGSPGHLLVEGAEREDRLVQALQECEAAMDTGKCWRSTHRFVTNFLPA